MNRVLLLIAVACTLSACEKSGAVNANVFGKYELRASYGGLMYRYNKFEPGNGNIFQFKSDSTYVRYANGTITESGNYHINIKGTEGGARYGTITFDEPVYLDNFRIKADTITIGTTAADGIASDYVKLKQ
nr:hypothetical protein [uncultured Mucilaginibacter sp.]